MLRASSEHDDAGYSLQGILQHGDSGVPHAALLVEFAEAMLGDDQRRQHDARQQLRQTLGEAALADAAAVVASFDAVVKIADASGILLEEDKARATVELRAELDLNADGWRAT